VSYSTERKQIEARSAVFKKELGVRDLALTQILFVVGLPWVGAAATLGRSHVIVWLLAIVLFYIPSAMVVIYLNRDMPLEGGLYQWARLGFNDCIGFLVGWNLWLYVIALTSEIGLQAATSLAYAMGPRAQWMAGSKWFITAANCAVISALALVSVIGLSVGKWVHNAGGVVILAIFAALIALPFLNANLGAWHPFQTAAPAVSLFSLNLLGKMGFGALGGFEYVGILAGECRDPARAIGRSVVIAAPVIAIMFILGTSSVLFFVRPQVVDLIGPIQQVLSLGAGPLGIGSRIVPVAIVAVLGLRIAQASVNFTGNTRLPMVAGWDRLLPDWFTKLHPKYKTPVNSILFVGAITLALSVAGLIGVGHQEAFQLLWNTAGTFYALTYLVMFAIPVCAPARLGHRPPLWLRGAAISGFLMTLLNVALSVFPIIEVKSRLSFTAKISGVILVGNGIGLVIFWIAETRRRTRFLMANTGERA